MRALTDFIPDPQLAEPAVGRDDEARPARSGELQTFFIKVATVLVAALLFGWIATAYVAMQVDAQIQKLSYLKGGATFWADVEKKLGALADAPDMPPEKKAALIAKVEAVARKFRPFADALAAPPKDAGVRSRINWLFKYWRSKA